MNRRCPIDPKAPPQGTDIETARRFAIEAARLIADTHCRDVAVLEVAGISPVTDILVLATGTSPRQMRGVCDEVKELADSTGRRAFAESGYEGESWILVDFIDVIVHLFSPEARRFYDLDNLWGDAATIEWQAAPDR